MTAAFKEYTGWQLKKSKKISVRKKLSLAKERQAKHGAGEEPPEGAWAGALSKKKTVKRKNKGPVKETVTLLLGKGRKKLSETVKGNLPSVDWKRLLIRNLPYGIVFYLVDKVAWLYRYCIGGSLIEKFRGYFF